MNARIAKKLRATLGFAPGAERHYDIAKGTRRRQEDGHITGTIRAAGARRQYQAVKRAGLVHTVLGVR